MLLPCGCEWDQWRDIIIRCDVHKTDTENEGFEITSNEIRLLLNILCNKRILVNMFTSDKKVKKI